MMKKHRPPRSVGQCTAVKQTTFTSRDPLQTCYGAAAPATTRHHTAKVRTNSLITSHNLLLINNVAFINLIGSLIATALLQRLCTFALFFLCIFYVAFLYLLLYFISKGSKGHLHCSEVTYKHYNTTRNTLCGT